MSARLISLGTGPTRIVFGLAALAFALAAGWESRMLERLPGVSGIGPGAFPGLVSVVMAVSAVALLTGRGDAQAQPFTLEAPLRVLSATAALIALVIAMGQVPILLVIAAFVVLFQLILGERRPLLLFGGAAAITAAIWFGFHVLLNTPL